MGILISEEEAVSILGSIEWGNPPWAIHLQKSLEAQGWRHGAAIDGGYRWLRPDEDEIILDLEGNKRLKSTGELMSR